MAGNIRPTTEIDRDLRRAGERFAEEVGKLSGDIILREGILRAAICTLVRSLENEFEGYEDILGKELITHGDLLVGSYEQASAET
jgi:hypothetical protein